MATSTNYGWAEPDNTDLVTNGAQAIRTLGNAIDTSLWNSGYGQAGKNKIINADCRVAQRGSSVTTTGTGYFYGAVDRFLGYSSSASTATVSQQSFTPGTAPVAPYEAPFFVRSVSTNTATYLAYRIEDVRVFAGQTITISFYAKTDVAQTLSAVSLQQNFGSGGSGSVTTTMTLAPALTTSWTRFSGSVAIPSISGKTVGTSSYLQIQLQGALNKNLDVWGLQAEYGSTATPFQTASGGSIQGELAMCQRYYWRETTASTFGFLGFGSATTTTDVICNFLMPVEMRVTPTSLDFSTLCVSPDNATVTAVTSATLTANKSNPKLAVITVAVASGLTAFRPYFLLANNSAAAYVAFIAEL